MKKIFFAPLQGYTEDAYRRFHREIFGGVDEYYSPFVRLEHREIRSKDWRDIRPDFNEGIPMIPQLIANGGDELRLLLDKVLPLGYKCIDINMGCPFPLQTRHGRGAGLLPHTDKVKEIADIVKRMKEEHGEVAFSVKMRLGLSEKDEWREVIPVLNDTPLRHITVHPRIASQQYKGEVMMDEFENLLKECHHPVVYNGDILAVSDIDNIEKRFGDSIDGVMIGRGLLARPSLAWEYKNGVTLTDEEVMNRVYDLHSRLLAHYDKIIPGESQLLNKIRTFWDYLEPLIGRKQWKKLQKAGNIKNYNGVLLTLF